MRIIKSPRENKQNEKRAEGTPTFKRMREEEGGHTSEVARESEVN